MTDKIVVPIAMTYDEIRAAFTEWERRYREEPERFYSEAAKLLRETPQTYGDAATPYFLAIVMEARPEVWAEDLS